LMTVSLGLFASCSYESQEEAKKEEGYVYCVTYDAGGGYFGANVSRTYTLVKPGSLTPAPGYKDANQSGVIIPSRRNHQLIAEDSDNCLNTRSWYLAETDENGEIIYEVEGDKKTPKLKSDIPWDFTKDKVNSDITLVAMWEEVYTFVLYVTTTNDKGEEVLESLGKTYLSYPGGSITKSLYHDLESEHPYRADNIKVKVTGKDYTLLGLYLDKELTVPYSFDYVHPGSRDEQITEKDEEGNTVTKTVQTNEVKIYADYLVGKYEFITNENKSALSTDSKWYLLEDVEYYTADVLTGETVQATWEKLDEFNGEIYGNGYSLKGVKISSQPIKGTSMHSMFGTINGVIEDVTFIDFTLNVEANRYADRIVEDQRVALLAYKLGESSRLTGVVIEDCSITLTNSSKFSAIFNLTDGKGLWYETATTDPDVKVIANGAEVSAVTPTAD